MKLNITSIKDKGDLENERIELIADRDCDLTYYMLFKTELVEEKIFNNKSQSVYWFAPRRIRNSDKIFVYTKMGENTHILNDDGTVTYIYYWDLTQPIFINEKALVVLVEIENWVTT